MAEGGVGVQALSVDECLRLLEAHTPHVGRIAFVDGGDPVILPVNYRFDRGSVVFRSDDGAKLALLQDGRRIAFEIDALDETWQEGWNVLVRGRCEEVTDPAELDEMRALPLRPWAGGEKAHYLRIQPGTISGRRIV